MSATRLLFPTALRLAVSVASVVRIASAMFTPLSNDTRLKVESVDCISSSMMHFRQFAVS